jgi:hypothetical protein
MIAASDFLQLPALILRELFQFTVVLETGLSRRKQSGVRSRAASAIEEVGS